MHWIYNTFPYSQSKFLYQKKYTGYPVPGQIQAVGRSIALDGHSGSNCNQYDQCESGHWEVCHLGRRDCFAQ